MLTLDVETSLPRDARRWQMSSAAILNYSIDVGSRLIVGYCLLLYWIIYKY